jgi:DNA-binding PadR family transcriptional regulator
MLLILSEGPAGAGAVGERLEGFGFHCDPHLVARRLHSLERCGLVRPCADRRCYRLTPRGDARLDASAEAIHAVSRRLESFLSRCEERCSGWCRG